MHLPALFSLLLESSKCGIFTHPMDNNFGTHVVQCHMCKAGGLFPVLDLGFHPPSDAFLRPSQLHGAENSYPLRLVSCSVCGLLQIDYVVHPEILFQLDYPYFSSATATGRAHYVSMAKNLVESFSTPRGSLAVDIGSNTGVLLGGFEAVGLKALGVDPAPTAAREAIRNGLETVIDFFNLDVARRIVASRGRAQIITATNVFAHMAELDSAVKGMKALLAKNGVIAIEAPYAVDLIENLEYDTIYHEHISYLSVRPMAAYLRKFGLTIFDAKKFPIHGGTLRYYVCHAGAYRVRPAVRAFLKLEERSGLYSKKRLTLFAEKVRDHKLKLVNLLLRLKKKGKRIACLSAPAKGNTLLNYCHLDTHMIDFLTEKTQFKIGRYSPGTHIPVRSDQELLKEKPDYALILAWNFADELMKNNAEFKRRGGKFIIPIPEPRIV